MVWITKRFLIAAALLALSYGGALADAAGPIQWQQVPSSSSCSPVFNTTTGAVTCSAGSGGITQLTGDGTAGPGSGSQALTLATVNSNVGTFGDSTHVARVTVNAKGQVTAAASVAVSGGGSYTAPVVAQSTTISHGTSPQTATFGSTPTVGNLMVFFVSGYTSGGSNYFTPPAGVSYICQQSQTNEGVAIFARPVQAGDGSSYAFTSPANDFSVTGIEASGVSLLQCSTVDLGINGSSTATNTLLFTTVFKTTSLMFGLFNIESATAAVPNVGYTTLQSAFSGGISHASVVTYATSGFSSPAPAVTWVGGSTSQPVMGATVSLY